MVKIRQFSIRYKILLLLTLIPLLVLAAYLFIAVNVFTTDKTAYVFDSTSTVSQSVATQTKIELNSYVSLIRPIIQDYFDKNEFSQLAQSVFDSESSLDVVSVYKLTDQRLGLLKVLEKESGLMQSLLKSFTDFNVSVYKSLQDQRVVRVLPQSESIFLFEKVINNQTQEVFVFMIAFRSPELVSVFKSTRGTNLYLVHKDGSVFFGPEGQAGGKISDLLVGLNLDDQQAFSSSRALALKNSEQQEMLVSYAPASFADLFVVSSVQKSKALAGVDVLIRKSLLFFGLLICATVIISLLASSQLTAALTDLFVATRKVAEGHFDIRVPVKTNDEIGSLADSFNLMAEEVSRLLSETAEKARMESELKTAQTVQETLFPPSDAVIGDLKISGFYEPASECGGDWWHYCQVDKKVMLWIGDATGHGAPAALITSAAKSAATIIERLNVGPAKAMELLNRAIYDVSKGRIMMTFFLASYDTETHQFVYANASHEAPYFIQKSDQPLKKKNLIPLNEVNNPRLGQARDTQYEETTIQLEKGDTVFFYTDGIPDIRNLKEEAWGEREFIKALIESHKEYPAPQVAVKKIHDIYTEYRQGTVLIDDVTYFSCQREESI